MRTSVGRDSVRFLLGREHQWLKARIRAVAARYRIDADDLEQDLYLRLLRNDYVVVKHDDRGLRTWLDQRIRWTAMDLLREETRRRRTIDVGNELLPEPAAPAPVAVDPSVSIDRLAELGLNRHEAQNVLVAMSGLDITLQELAAATNRTYATVRSDRSRALRKLRALLDLSDAEEQAQTARRAHSTHAAAAAELGLSEPELERLLQASQKKIDTIFGLLRSGSVVDDDAHRE